ncbi:hypothetical protein [uncultured Senegalimassilia sp.]|uniref:hypothetical protein n=1 Tax=uncultured Senegalimassilia sp. TaxID=1714350 RepID=UPI0026764832|nr:hypothetical protein [uncultured Senegalimassilia sp.]
MEIADLMDETRIIQMHLSGKSNREIAGDLGPSRKMVDKYVVETTVCDKRGSAIGHEGKLVV